MPEYSLIQTYIRCDETKFNDILKTYSKLLIEIGFPQKFLIEA